MVAEDEVVDAAYLKKVLNNETSKDIPFFDMWNKMALLNLTEYLERNDYIVVPGKYVINQAWGFEEGYIIVGDEKQEILKFKSKNK